VLAVPAAAVSLLVVPRGWVAVVVLLGAAGWGGLALRQRASAHRAVRCSRDAVLTFCEDLAADLGAGLPAGRALATASRGWPMLGSVARAHDLGGSVPDALRDLAARPGAGELRLVAAAWQVGQRNGAALSGTLEVAAASIRTRNATRRVVESELASARATARLVAGLPVLTLAMGSGAGGSPVSFLFSTPLGLACLAGGLVLTLLGLWWIEVIAAGVEGPAP
jgi:tight adherence protein B